MADLSTPPVRLTYLLQPRGVLDKYRDVPTRDQPRQQTVDKSSNTPTQATRETYLLQPKHPTYLLHPRGVLDKYRDVPAPANRDNRQ